MATDIKNDATLSTSLISVFCEDSTVTTDLHGSNTLTENSDNTIGTVAGVQGTACDFELDDSESLSRTDGDQTNLDPTSEDFSVAMWVKPETQPGNGLNRTLLAKWRNSGANDRSYSFNYWNNGGTFQLVLEVSSNGTANERTTVAQTLTNGTDYHIGFTRDVSTKTTEFFVNGSSIGGDTGSIGAISDEPEAFAIAAQNIESGTATGHWDGVINQVCFWFNKVTSDQEFVDLYNGGSGIPYEAVAVTFIPKVFYG